MQERRARRGADAGYDDHVSGSDQPRGLVALALALAFACAPAVAQQPGGTAIVVRADEAHESLDGEVLTVTGALTVRAPDWRLDAASGRIVGALEDPDLIEVEGMPARLEVRRPADTERFEGSSEYIAFRPKREAVALRGDALVVKGAQSIRSGRIDYVLENDTFTAGFGGRVKVVTTPDHAR